MPGLPSYTTRFGSLDDYEKGEIELSELLGPRVVARIDDVRVHVPLDRAEAPRRLTSDRGVDGVGSLGGGSATGLGKAIALTNDVTLVAIPTTYAQTGRNI